MPFLPDEREYREMPVEICTRAEDIAAGSDTANNSMKVRGYCTTYNQPYLLHSGPDFEVWERVAPGAFEECDETDVIMQYDHRGHVYARNSNGTLSLGDDDHGHSIEAELSGTTIGRQLYEEIRGGYTTKMSMGFTIAEMEKVERWENIGETGEKLIIDVTLTKLRKLYDVSAVSLPANPGTEIGARNSYLTRSAYINGVIEDARKEIAKRREQDKKRKMLALKLKLMEVKTDEY